MLLEVMLGVGPLLPRHGGYDYKIFQVEVSAGRLLEPPEKNCYRFHTEAIGHYWNKIGITHGGELELRGHRKAAKYPRWVLSGSESPTGFGASWA